MALLGNRQGRILIAALLLAVTMAPSPAALAHTDGGPVVEEVTGVRGPFTFEGIAYDPSGRPAVGCLVRLLPVRPGKGVDTDNTFYKIEGYNDHRTVTDSQGRFIMTGIQDYPEVKHHTYRIVVNADYRLPFNQPFGAGVVSLAALTSERLFFEFRTEPAVTVKLVVKDKAGRPFTGTRAVSVTTGHNVNFVATVRFTNGTGHFYTTPGDVKSPGRVALLRWETARDARQEDLAQGHEPGLGNRLLYGIEAQRNALLIPGQPVTLEFVLDE